VLLPPDDPELLYMFTVTALLEPLTPVIPVILTEGVSEYCPAARPEAFTVSVRLAADILLS